MPHRLFPRALLARLSTLLGAGSVASRKDSLVPSPCIPSQCPQLNGVRKAPQALGQAEPADTLFCCATRSLLFARSQASLHAELCVCFSVPSTSVTMFTC